MPITLRSPGGSPFTAPPVSWLQGTWHVTHSTLPMWRSKRNVRITYTALPASDPSLRDETDRLDDLVSYQGLSGDAVSTVRGVDRAAPGRPGAWNWRGKGWLMIASSAWEVLGYGDEDGGWAVTYFAKTLFTPAGVDVYSRRGEGLGEELLLEIRKALGESGNEEVKRLAGEVFAVRMD